MDSGFWVGCGFILVVIYGLVTLIYRVENELDPSEVFINRRYKRNFLENLAIGVFLIIPLFLGISIFYLSYCIPFFLEFTFY